MKHSTSIIVLCFLLALWPVMEITAPHDQPVKPKKRYTIKDPCSGVTKINYGGSEYTVVAIGKQCWFTENLNIGEMQSGKKKSKDNNTIEKYCYDDGNENCAKYGALYTWDEAMAYDVTSSQGLCPDGWHIPTGADWQILSDYLGGDSIAGGKMKSTEKGAFCFPNPLITPTSGFNGLASGCRYAGDGSFCYQKHYGGFWSSSAKDTDQALLYCIHFDDTRLGQSAYDKKHGFAVRCIMD